MRGFIVFVAIAAAVVLVIAVARPRVSTQLVEMRVAEYVDQASGGKSRIAGESSLRLRPFPVVTVKKVEIAGIGDADHPAHIEIPSMEVSFQLLPLLLGGELEVDGITLDRPLVRLGRAPVEDRADTIETGWGSVIRAVMAADGAAHKAGAVHVRDGRVELESPDGGWTEEMSMPDMHLTRTEAQETVHLAGNADWRGFQIQIKADFVTPEGAQSEFCCEGELSLQVGPAETEAVPFSVPVLWDGETQSDPDEAYSFGKLLNLATTGASLRLTGAFKAGKRLVEIEHAAVELGGMAAEGSLGVDLDGQYPKVSAELAFEKLDVGRHLHAFLPASLDAMLEWPVRADIFGDTELDLTAVVADAALGDITFAGPSIRLVADRSGTTLTLERTEVAEGHIEGKLAVRPAGQEALVQLSGNIGDVSLGDIGDAVRDGAGRIPVGQDRPPEGYVTASIDLSGKGPTLGAVIRSLRGWGASVVRDGSLAGADIVATLERVADNSTLVDEGKPLIPVAGRTYFSIVVASAAITEGVVRVPHVHFRGENFKIDFSGDVDLSQGEIEAEGSAALIDAGSSGNWESLIELPFGIGGTVREPMFAPGIPGIGGSPIPPSPATDPDAAGTGSSSDRNAALYDNQ